MGDRGRASRAQAVLLTLIALVQATAVNAGPGAVEGSKSQTVYYKVDPAGVVSEGSVEVLIRMSSPTGEKVVGSLVDRVQLVDPGTISPLLGTPGPSSIEDFYGHQILVWPEVSVELGDSEFRYTAQTSAPPPLLVNVTLSVNGVPVSPVELEGGWYVEVDPGDEFNLTFRVENLRPTVRTDISYGKPPVMYTVQVSLSKSHFSEPSGHPAPSMVFPTSDEWVLSWVGVLWDEPENVTVSARVRVSAPEGFLDMPSITVQASYDVSPVVEQLESARDSLDEIIESLEQMNDSMAQMVEGMEELSFWLGEARSRLSEAEDGLYKLADALEEAGRLSGEAAEEVDRAAEEVDHALGDARSALAVVSDLRRRVEEFQESYQNLTSAIRDLLEDLNVSLPGPPPQGGVLAAIEAAESQIESVLRRGDQIVNSMTGLAWAMRNASTSFESAAEMARSSAKDVESLSEALSFAQSAADRGAESAREGLDDLQERLKDARSQREEILLKISLAKSPWIGAGVAEFTSGGSTARVDPVSSELNGSWVTWAVSALGSSGTAAGVAVHLQQGDRATVLMLGPGGWGEVSPGELVRYGIVYDEGDSVLYLPGPLNLSADGPTNLTVQGIPVSVSSSRPPAYAEVDLVSGQRLEVERRVILKVSLPTLAVGIPVTPREEGTPETAPPEAAGRSRPQVWPFALGAAAVAAAVMALRLAQQRAEERRVLLARIGEMVSQLEELEEDIVDRLRELGEDGGEGVVGAGE